MNGGDGTPILVSEQEAAKLLGLCTKTLYNLRVAGKLPYVKLDSDKRPSIRYRVASLIEWAEKNEIRDCERN